MRISLVTVPSASLVANSQEGPRVVGVVDRIAEILNAHGLRPGGSAWPGKSGARFTAQRVQYIVHAYGLRLRYDRLRARGLLTKPELAALLGIHEATPNELGQARHCQVACVQGSCVPLRGAAESADEALQPMGSTDGSSQGNAEIS